MDFMKDYMKPSLKENPGSFIFNIETNDLNTKKDAEHITKKIIDLGRKAHVLWQEQTIHVSNKK